MLMEHGLTGNELLPLFPWHLAGILQDTEMAFPNQAKISLAPS